MRKIVAAVALGLAAAGCSSKAQPADGGSYPSAQAVLDQLAKNGAPCAKPSPVANPTSPGALSMTGCFGVSSAANSDTVITVFDTHDDALAAARQMLAFEQGMGNVVNWEIVGVNWLVNTVPAYAPKVVAALGGQRIQS